MVSDSLFLGKSWHSCNGASACLFSDFQSTEAASGAATAPRDSLPQPSSQRVLTSVSPAAALSLGTHILPTLPVLGASPCLTGALSLPSPGSQVLSLSSLWVLCQVGCLLPEQKLAQELEAWSLPG